MDKQFYNRLSTFACNKAKVAFNIEGNKITYNKLLSKANYCAYYFKKNLISKIAIVENHSLDTYFLICGAVLSKTTFTIVRNDKDIETKLLFFKPDIIFYKEKEPLQINSLKCRIYNDLASFECSQKIELTNVSKNPTLYVAWTSGTTSTPKGVRISSKGFIHFLNWSLSFFQTKNNYKWVDPTDLFHDLGLVNFFISIFNGIQYIPALNLHSRLFFSNFIKINKATHFRVVPRYLDIILKSCKKNDIETLKSLKLVGFGGDQLSIKAVLDLFSINNSLQVYNSYGATETCGFNSLALINKDNIDGYTFGNYVSIGKPFDNNKFEITESSELIVSKPNLNLGYITAPINFQSNEFHTKDEAIVLNGNYFIIGRKSRIIKHKGMKVNLDSLDSLLATALSCKVRSIFFNDIILIFKIKNDVSNIDIINTISNKDEFKEISFKIISIDKFVYNDNQKIDDYKMLNYNKNILDGR
ncbi:AMP-binding protein [Kordia sp. TARA_039_SRF]|nr:AMP-binding protein [Kordia sp. TARA_039_SRF]